MMIVLRVVASVLAAVWAVLFFAIIDLSILFIWNEWFVDVAPLEVSWGAFLTFFMTMPLVAVAVRPTVLWSTVTLDLIAAVSLALGAVVSAYPSALWLALAAFVTAAIVAGIGLSATRRGRMVPAALQFGVHWVLLLLAAIGVPLWVPYIVHAVEALGVLPSDMSLGLDHWPVQAAAGIAVVLGAFAAATLPQTRAMAGVAVSLCAVTIGVSAASHFETPVATETAGWGILCVLWGTGVALALAVRTPRTTKGRPKDGPSEISIRGPEGPATRSTPVRSWHSSRG